MKHPPLDLEWDELADLRWFCRDCAQFRVHPYKRVGDDRFHSHYCKTPMIRVLVTIRQVDLNTKKSEIEALMGGVMEPDYERIYYLSGPMGGYPEKNYPLFTRVAAELRDSGLNVVSPHEVEPAMDSPGPKDYLEADIRQMLNGGCSALVLLPGWPKSPGARVELELALSLGYEVWFYRDGELIYMGAE